MKTASALYKNHSFCKEKNDESLIFEEVQLVIGFGSSVLVSQEKSFFDIKNKFPNAEIALCSSAGEIYENEVLDDTISLVAIQFQTTTLKTSEISIEDFESSYEAGKTLIKNLPQENLRLIFVLSDGGKVNGSELVKGMNFSKKKDVLITGGLAGDGSKFEKTFVGLNQVPQIGKIIAIGFYGDKLVLSHGSFGGWESFGLEKTVTKSKANTLFEIDNNNALTLYKTYLGKYADELPGSALLFPLSVKFDDDNITVVRTILSIDNENQSITFAGDIPEGSKVRFMKANLDRLIDAASDAADSCIEMVKSKPKIAILISCVGRKLIMPNRIDEEIEAISEIFGTGTMLTGFYSYGEISPLNPMANCELQNQTMTITGINEIV
ncbi:FIST signal transduction protein [Flavobacterium soyangense]|uniref:FIST C-terminal domain-containing protein n=1 Tax=Flavobacterium soyangense TaxID=2023265 RepID=A0A930XUZ8_9FLAO|nr:FIST N-terminal domain-containing protein [Flavobacterium soyangense]MBF2707567.1 FIST C-terminal domain-containing protein [Flavobacterium soyangense]